MVGTVLEEVISKLKNNRYMISLRRENLYDLMVDSGLEPIAADALTYDNFGLQVERMVHLLCQTKYQGGYAGQKVPALSAFLYQLILKDIGMQGDVKAALQKVADDITEEAHNTAADSLPDAMSVNPAEVIAALQAAPKQAVVPARARVLLDRNLLIALDMEGVKNSVTNSLQSLPSGVFAYSVGSQHIILPELDKYIVELIISQINATSRRNNYDRRNFSLTPTTITYGSQFLERAATSNTRAITLDNLLKDCQKDLFLVFRNYEFPNADITLTIQSWWESVRDQAQHWADQTGKYLIVILANSGKDPLIIPAIEMLPLPAKFDKVLLERWLRAQMSPHRPPLDQAKIDSMVASVVAYDGSLMNTYIRLGEIADILRKGKLEAL